jgi:predicted dehydrogenase
MIKVAFVGAGNMAENHIKAFKNIDNVNLVGIYSRTFSKASQLAAKYGIANTYNSIQEMYEKSKSDLVIVTVSVSEIKDICFKVFEFPWISLIEKPIGSNVNEATEIFQYAEKMQHKAYVAFNRRHYSSVQAAIKISKIDTTEKRLIQIFDQEDLEEAKEDGHPQSVLDDWMYANSIHLIDLFNVLGRGKIESVENFHKWHPEKPFYTNSIIKYSSGDLGIYNCVWNQPAPWSISISNRNFRLELKPIEDLFYQLRGKRISTKVDFDKTLDLEFKPGLRVQALEAVKAARGIPNTLPSIKDGLNSMYLVKKIYGI